MLPPDGSFLKALHPSDIDGQPNLDEKEILLIALQFYFGPGLWWNTVRNELNNEGDLNTLHDILRAPGERYDILEQKTSLSDGYFAEEHQAPGQVKLYAAPDTRENPDNPEGLPSYFLFEAKNNLTFYVGPGYIHLESQNLLRHVFNTLVLHHKGTRKHRPSQSHTMDFGFLDDKGFVLSDLEFLSDEELADLVTSLRELGPDDMDGPPSKDEKRMLRTALQFYFGPGKKLKAVAKDKPDFPVLNALLRERYTVLEQQTSLPDDYFNEEHNPPDQVKFYVATDRRKSKDNPQRLPSYLLHEAKYNLMCYIGPDFFHGRPAIKAINIIKLKSDHSAQESHTLDFGFVEKGS
jgi:hypothetical protein